MGGSGRYLESRRAVEPVSVKMAMAASSRSSAEWAMHSQMVSATERRLDGGPWRRTGGSRRIWCSVSATILAIMATVSTGYLPAAGFAGEHDGGGAVVDGVGDVGGFGAGGPRILDHGFEHLGGGDDGLAIFSRAANDVLLDGGNFLGRNFDAEVAAGDHDAVGDFEDGVEMFDGLGLLEFSDDPTAGLEGVETAADVADVVGGADEGDGDGSRRPRLRAAEDEVFLVLLGERERNFDRGCLGD